MNSNLFHYTEALQYILEENQLGLTRVDKVKDSTELETLTEILIYCFKKYRRKLEQINVNINSMTKEFIGQRNKSYIFCASHNNGNDYLWDQYAKSDGGACIEFDKSYFPFSSGRGGDIEKFPNEIFVKAEMIYGKQNFICEFESWLNFFVKQDNSANRQFLLLVSTLTDCYKPNDFQKEDEVRIVYLNENDISERIGGFFSPNTCKNSTKEQQYMLSTEKPEYLNYKFRYDKNWGIHHAIRNIYVRNCKSYEKAQKICSKFSFNVNLLTS